MADDSDIIRELRNLNKSITQVCKFIEQTNAKQTHDAIYKDIADLQRKLANHSNEFVRRMAGRIDDIEDAKKMGGKSVIDFVNVLDKAREDLRNNIGIASESTKIALDGVNLSLDDLEHSNEHLVRGHRAMQRVLGTGSIAFQDNTEAVEGSTLSLTAHAKNLEEISANLKSKAFAFAVWGATEAVDVLKASTQAGIKVTKAQVIDSRMLGMSHVELIQTQQQYKQSMSSAGMTTDEFSNFMKTSSQNLLLFTGSLTDGAKLATESNKLFRMSGASYARGLEGFTADMGKSFKYMNNMTGMTVERFNELNSEMVNNSDVQKNMVKMAQGQRAMHLQDMIAQRTRLVSMGLFEEQAQEVMSSLAELVGKGAKDRIGDAAKLEATLGAMGMGAQGQEAAAILRKGARASSDEKARFEQIMALAAKQSAQQQQGSLGQELSMDALLSRGMDAYFGPSSPMAKVVTMSANGVDKNGDPNAPDREGLLAVIKKLVITVQDIANTLIGGSWIEKTLAGIVAIFTGKSMLNKIVKAVRGGIAIEAASNAVDTVGKDGKGKGKGKGAKAGLAKKLTKLTGKISLLTGALTGTSMAAGIGTAVTTAASSALALVIPTILVSAAGAAGLWVGSKINDAIDEHAPELGNAIGASVNAVMNPIDTFMNTFDPDTKAANEQKKIDLANLTVAGAGRENAPYSKTDAELKAEDEQHKKNLEMMERQIKATEDQSWFIKKSTELNQAILDMHRHPQNSRPSAFNNGPTYRPNGIYD